MKPSNLKTPRLLRDAYLQGISFAAESESKWGWVALGMILGFVLGALV